MINVVYTLIALSMLTIFWYLSINEDDDDMGGGKMIPAYQQAER